MAHTKKIPVYQLEELDGKDRGVFLLGFSDEDVKSRSAEAMVPHRHDHYTCFFIESGSIDFYVDFQPVKLHKQSLLISYPGQVHQSSSDKGCKGYVLIFKAGLTDQKTRMIIEESLTKVALLTLDDKDNDWFKKLFELLHAALHISQRTIFEAQLIQSLLNAFMYRAASLYQQQENTRISEYSSRNIDITKKFRQLLQQNFREMKKPSEYAEKMNFSASYLNDTVKAVTGFPLTFFIRQEVISEAQRLLYYSELSVKEIAYNLGYEDDKYFIRLFGKSTGISPANFRKSRKDRSQSDESH